MKKNDAVFPFVVTLQQKNRKTHALLGLVTGFILILALLERMLLKTETRWLHFGVSIAVIGIFLHNILLFKRNKRPAMAAAFWAGGLFLLITPPFNPLSLLFLVMALLESHVNKPEEIGFGEDGLHYNRLIKKQTGWQEMENVILKDGILTLEYKDGRVSQRETEFLEEDEDDATEEEFNFFCQNRLSVYTTKSTQPI